jgi:hypothetical protein
MTDQRDWLRRTRRDDLRSEDESWGVAPILLAVAFVFFLAYMFLASGLGTQPERTVTGQRGELPNPAPSAPSLPAPTPPRPQ